MASRTRAQIESPTLPLPPPRAERIDLEHFFEVASAASLRALAAHQQVELNPQPEPPGGPRLVPQIWVGIIASLVLPANALQGAPSGAGGVTRSGSGQ
jgi:hypothetical protein